MLKRLVLALSFSSFAACGTDWWHEVGCLDGCDRPSHDSGRTPDDNKRPEEQPTVVYIPGPPGPPGPAGKDGVDGKDGRDGVGQNGHSTVFLIGPAAPEACPTGGSTLLVALDVNDNGILDLTEDANLQSATICNGAVGATGATGEKGDPGEQGPQGEKGDPGEDGQDAPAPLAPVAVIDPCGDASGILDEVLLRLSDGTVLAARTHRSDGRGVRLVILAPGNYTTTDGSNCRFTVTSDGAIVNEHY